MTDSSDIDKSNDHFVGVQNGKIVVLLPPMLPMPVDEALRFAAWIVCCVQAYDLAADEHFAEILEAVCNS